MPIFSNKGRSGGNVALTGSEIYQITDQSYQNHAKCIAISRNTDSSPC